MRWPDKEWRGYNIVGAVCPNGHSVKSTDYIDKTNRYYCNVKGCRKLFSPLYGTFLKQSRLPLWKWFAFINMYHSSNPYHKSKLPSGRQVARQLKVSSSTGSTMIATYKKSLVSDAKLISNIYHGLFDALNSP